MSIIYFLLLSIFVFCIGIFGILMNRSSLLAQLMAIELLLLAAAMNFITLSYFLDDPVGQLFVFFILTVAAAESAIGLSIWVLLYRRRSKIELSCLNEVKG